MKKNTNSIPAFLTTRFLLSFALFCIAGLLAALGINGQTRSTSSQAQIDARVAGALSRTRQHSAVATAAPSRIANDVWVASLRWIRSFRNQSHSSIAPRLAMRAASGQRSTASATSSYIPVPSDVVVPGLSLPVRDIPSADAYSTWVQQPEEPPLENRVRQQPINPGEIDPVLQAAPTVSNMPAIGVSFEGINIDQGCDGGCLPPDPNGAVGPNHYVQTVNAAFAIYDKAGNVIKGPTAINVLWSSAPPPTSSSACALNNDGDPVVVYDQLADRWIISQFTVSTPYAECIAVSQTGDPTGSYWLYQFNLSFNVFNDYPKLGVWPDGYYMSANQFPRDGSAAGSNAGGAYVFERAQMLQGQPARTIFFDELPLILGNVDNGQYEAYAPGGQLPTSLDGTTLPPAGSPNYFAEVDDMATSNPYYPNPPPTDHDEMRVWKFHVDWNNLANSTFGTGSTTPRPGGFAGLYTATAGQPDFIIPIANYISSACQIEDSVNDCSPEKLSPPHPLQYLDVIGDRLMNRLAYRNFGDHESLLVSHTADTPVDPSTGVARNGVRWYEIRDLSSGTPTVYQQGTFAPFDPTSTDGPLWRWMGSIAMDQSGDIAIGYSASGPNYFPSLHYAGRLANDPLNELTQGEAVMFAGQGIEVDVGIYYRNRWGDYSALTVDPTDNCTFWYTNEYVDPKELTSTFPVVWHTRIASFKFPQCVPPTPPQLVSVASRKTHTGVGDFDIDLTTGNGIECRSGGANGDYELVFTFATPLTSVGGASITTGSGSVASSQIDSTDAHNYIVSLTGVTNAQRITVGLTNVTDSSGGSSAVVPASMGVLLGDVNGSGRVDAADVSSVRQQTLQPITTSNFQEDVNLSGRIDAADVSVVRQQTLTSLP
jgi:hypothetical protein